MKSKANSTHTSDVKTFISKSNVSCTQAMALGSTSLKGNLNAQNGDEPINSLPWEHLLIKLSIPEKGYRYLSHGHFRDWPFPTINEKGVSVTYPGRFSQIFPPYPGKAEYLTDDDLLRTSGSAKEYVQKWDENFTKYGGIENVGRTIVDPKEGYYIEGLNYIYGDPANHNIQGPITDMVFAGGNFFQTGRFKQYQEGIGCGYNRAKRVWQMLIDRQYDCSVLPNGGITLPYFMSIWRDHGNISPEEQRMSDYIPEERGALTVCCHGGTGHRTAKSIISVSIAEHTNLLSSMWITFGQPCISPFLPFYIGINAIPDIVSTKANPVAQVFERLRLALDYHPEYRPEITHYCTVFEIQTIEEAEKLEADIIILADDGKEMEARALLTEFVEKKCNEAMSVGSKWLEFLQNLPLTQK
jgi:hypothetical protein